MQQVSLCLKLHMTFLPEFKFRPSFIATYNAIHILRKHP